MNVLVPLVCELGHMQLALLQLLLGEPDSREGYIKLSLEILSTNLRMKKGRRYL